MADSEARQITDARVLAAMTHPLRRRLLSLLALDGPSTASTLAQQTDQAVANVSHHLRTLAAVDLIEEVPELARDRRERWWRRTSGRLSWASDDFAGDEAAEVVVRAAESLNLDYQVSRVREWAAAPEAEQEAWPDGPFSTDTWMRLTNDELAELSRELTAVMLRWSDRPPPDDGAERRPVFVFARGVPGKP
jgi:DNA-binding transcriptional ArsR family regulator